MIHVLWVDCGSHNPVSGQKKGTRRSSSISLRVQVASCKASTQTAVTIPNAEETYIDWRPSLPPSPLKNPGPRMETCTPHLTTLNLSEANVLIIGGCSEAGSNSYWRHSGERQANACFWCLFSSYTWASTFGASGSRIELFVHLDS